MLTIQITTPTTTTLEKKIKTEDVD